MDKKIFQVYLAKADVPNNDTYATLDLPASPWALWDAIEKVRLKDGEELYMEIEDYYNFSCLAPHLSGLDITLMELNNLAPTYPSWMNSSKLASTASSKSRWREIAWKTRAFSLCRICGICQFPQTAAMWPM